MAYFKPAINVPFEIYFDSDFATEQPANQYGVSYNYWHQVNGTKQGFYATEALHNQLMTTCGQGAKAKITKQEKGGFKVEVIEPPQRIGFNVKHKDGHWVSQLDGQAAGASNATTTPKSTTKAVKGSLTPDSILKAYLWAVEGAREGLGKNADSVAIQAGAATLFISLKDNGLVRHAPKMPWPGLPSQKLAIESCIEGGMEPAKVIERLQANWTLSKEQHASVASMGKLPEQPAEPEVVDEEPEEEIPF